MKQKLLLFIFFISFNVFSQNGSKQIEFTFENERITGKLISNLKNLINDVEVKIENQKAKKFRIEKMSAVTIENEPYVVSYNLIDTNLTTNVSNFNDEPNPNFKSNWILLKVLVEGEYSLFSYELTNFTQFYFSTPETKEIKPLIYKDYLISKRMTKSNVQFRNQLYKNAQHPTLSYVDYNRIQYKKNGLMKYFNQLNNYDTEKGVVESKVHFSVFGGIAFNKISHNNIGPGTPQEILYYAIIRNNSSNIIPVYTYTSPTIGIAVELPFTQKYQSAIFSNLSYSIYNQKYHIEQNEFEYRNINYELKSSVFLINLGYKHYFNIHKNIQLYGQAALSLTAFVNSKNLSTLRTETLTISENGFKSATNFGGSLGIGLKVNKHYFIEANFREPLNAGNSMKTITLGYTF